MNVDRKQQIKEFTDWASDQLGIMGDYAREIGLIPKESTAKAYWALPNRICIGQVWPKHDSSHAYWVITGDVTTDHLDVSTATSARDAARHFALRWQLHSAQLMQGLKDEKDTEIDWQKIGSELATKAEYLYNLVEDKEIWEHAVEFQPVGDGSQSPDESSEPA